MARPTKFKIKLANAICERLADGESLRSICRSEGMPNKGTVFRWLAVHAEFRDQYAYARELQADSYADETVDIADDSVNDYVLRQTQNGAMVPVCDHENIQRSKLRVDTRKWAAAKLRPKKYGEKIDLTHSGPNGQPIQTDNANATVDPIEQAKRWQEFARGGK